MARTAQAHASDPGRPLIDVTSWVPQRDHQFVATADPVWTQGRAVYGGVVGGGLARAMSAGVPDDRSLRSILVTFVGPLQSGAFECVTETLREGRSATFVAGRVIQDGTVRATATGTFGGARASSVHVPGPPRPAAPEPQSLAPMPYIEGVLPKVQQRLELRWTHGKYPFSAADGSSIGGWFRFRYDDDVADAPGLLALIDAWPAPALQNMEMPAPASSITWRVDLFGDLPPARLDQWWYFDARTTFTANGYTSFDADIWAPDGQYVARSAQLVGIFG